jgi:PAS domain S-box-containing protein
MAEPLKTPAPSQPEIDRLLSDPAFREFRERGSPAFLISRKDARLAWANEAAWRLFGPELEALPARLTGGRAIAGPTPFLKRLLIESGGVLKPVSFLTKRASLSDGREVLVAALLGTAAVAAMEATAQSGPAGEPSSESTGEPVPEQPGSADPHPATESLTAEKVRQRFLKTHRNPTVRFLWQTDEAGRLSSVTPPLSDIVGAANADLLGRELTEVVESLRLDPGGRLLAAMRVPETWSGIEVAWPILGAAAAVPVDLGGFPVFDGARVFRGFRGFGVIHLDRIRDAEAEPVRRDASSGPEVTTEASKVVVGKEVEEPPAMLAGEAKPAIHSIPAIAAPNVVPLRPFATLAAAFGFRPSPADMPAPAAGSANKPAAALPPAQVLSESEHDAFDEIARRLASEESSLEQPAPIETSQPSEGSDGAIALLDRLPLGVMISRDGVPVYANRMLLDLTGYASTGHLRAAGVLAGLFEGSAAAGNGTSTASISTRQGDLVPVESKLQAIAWQGQVASLLTLRRANDGAYFAEAKSLELELQRRDAELRELRAILDTAADGVAVLDTEGRILSLNRSAETLFGYEQNEVAGEPFTMFIASESLRFVEDWLDKLKSGIRSSREEREVFAAARQGGTIPIVLTFGRIDHGQSCSKFCAIIRDTSAAKRAELDAREAREEAERASAVKSDFLAKVSHEIRTPLNAIIGFAEVIMDERLGPIGTERYKDYLRDIHRSGTHVMSLVNDLLDLSKIEAGKMVLDIKPVDANAVISECVALMQPQANRERVIMRLALAPRLMHIAADERSLRQIVLNLLSNAVKYNEPGGQVIVSTAMTDTGQVVIRIKDTGIGMSDAELALALEPFRQIATARPVSGTGLGLPLTKALIEANRADITIRSRKNEGTLVEVRFPPARVLAESA